jgi:hypothetical protein
VNTQIKPGHLHVRHRAVYSENTNWPDPIFQIEWDSSAISIEAKAGTLDIKALTAIVQEAMKEIQEAVLKGKRNAKTKDGNSQAASPGTEA